VWMCMTFHNGYSCQGEVIKACRNRGVKLLINKKIIKNINFLLIFNKKYLKINLT
jgi:hypothetical protein